MDALEYEKARIRMCRTTILKEGGCAACPLYDGLRHRCWLATSAKTNLDIDTIETHIDRVIKWAKDNPIKTRQSEFLKMFPNVVMTRGVIALRPCRLDTQINECSGSDCDKCKRAYWLTEVTDND